MIGPKGVSTRRGLHNIYTQLAVGGHPIEGSVEIPAKWETGR
jgi:hypothetical protein